MSSIFLLRVVYLDNIHKICPIKEQLPEPKIAADGSQLGSLASEKSRSVVLPEATEAIDLRPFQLRAPLHTKKPSGQQVKVETDKVALPESMSLAKPYRRVDQNSARHASVDLPSLRFKLAEAQMKKRGGALCLGGRREARKHYRKLAVNCRAKKCLSILGKALARRLRSIERYTERSGAALFHKRKRVLKKLTARGKLFRASEYSPFHARALPRLLFSSRVGVERGKVGIKKKLRRAKIYQHDATVKLALKELILGKKARNGKGRERRAASGMRNDNSRNSHAASEPDSHLANIPLGREKQNTPDGQT